MAAITGATIFSFSPIVIQLGYGYLEYLNRYLIPLFIYLLFKYLRKPDIKTALYISFIYTLSWFCSIEIAIFILIIAIVIFITFVLIKLFQHKASSLNIINILKYSLIGLIFLPIIIYFFSPYIEYSYKEKLQRTLEETQYYSARPLDFLLTSPENIIYGKLSKSLEKLHYAGEEPPYSYGEHTLFPGFIVLALLSLLVVLKRGRQSWKDHIEIPISFVVLIFSIIFSFGPYLKIGSLTLKLPYYYLYHIFPLLGASRTPTRIVYVWLFLVSLLSAFGIEVILDSVKKKGAVIFISILILITAEYLTYFPHQTIDSFPLKFDLGGKNVLFLPIRKDIPSNQINATNYLIQHVSNNFVSINGHTGSEPSIEGYEYLMNTLKTTEFTNHWFNVLKILDISYVVIDKNGMNNNNFDDQPIKDNLLKYNNNTIFDDDNWAVIDISSVKGNFGTPCKKNNPSDLEYRFEPKYDEVTRSVNLYYDITNNANCDLSYIYSSRYYKVEYTIENPGKNGSFYIILPPFLLSGETYSGSLPVTSKLRTKPRAIVIRLGESTFEKTLEDEPMK
jgi:hypothetical protein